MKVLFIFVINIALSSNKRRVNKPRKNEKSYTYTVHQYFHMETKCRRKRWNSFSYMSLRITFIGSTNFLCSPATTGRRLQPPIFQDTTQGKLQLPNSLATTKRRLQTPMFPYYNQKVATTSCPLPVLSP
jgi:hypothetical protein